jgi:hypothetical protein
LPLFSFHGITSLHLFYRFSFLNEFLLTQLGLTVIPLSLFLISNANGLLIFLAFIGIPSLPK